MTHVIGWISSVILLATILKQIHKQWHDESSEGVSKWLFVGQTAASLGFTIYSIQVRNWVFVITNALLLVAAIAGFLITHRNLRRASRNELTTTTKLTRIDNRAEAMPGPRMERAL